MYRNRGIINPISIGAITFLLVSLLLGSVAVVRNNFDIRQRAALYNVDPLTGGKATYTPGCPSSCTNGCLTGTITCATQVLPTNPSPASNTTTTITSCVNGCGPIQACIDSCYHTSQAAPSPSPATTVINGGQPAANYGPPINTTETTTTTTPETKASKCICTYGCIGDTNTCLPPPRTQPADYGTATRTNPLTGGTATYKDTTTQEQADAFLNKDYGEDGLPSNQTSQSNTDNIADSPNNLFTNLNNAFSNPDTAPADISNTNNTGSSNSLVDSFFSTFGINRPNIFQQIATLIQNSLPTTEIAISENENNNAPPIVPELDYSTRTVETTAYYSLKDDITNKINADCSTLNSRAEYVECVDTIIATSPDPYDITPVYDNIITQGVRPVIEGLPTKQDIYTPNNTGFIGMITSIGKFFGSIGNFLANSQDDQTNQTTTTPITPTTTTTNSGTSSDANQQQEEFNQSITKAIVAYSAAHNAISQVLTTGSINSIDQTTKVINDNKNFIQSACQRNTSQICKKALETLKDQALTIDGETVARAQNPDEVSNDDEDALQDLLNSSGFGELAQNSYRDDSISNRFGGAPFAGSQYTRPTTPNTNNQQPIDRRDPLEGREDLTGGTPQQPGAPFYNVPGLGNVTLNNRDIIPPETPTTPDNADIDWTATLTYYNPNDLNTMFYCSIDGKKCNSTTPNTPLASILSECERINFINDCNDLVIKSNYGTSSQEQLSQLFASDELSEIYLNQIPMYADASHFEEFIEILAKPCTTEETCNQKKVDLVNSGNLATDRWERLQIADILAGVDIIPQPEQGGVQTDQAPQIPSNTQSIGVIQFAQNIFDYIVNLPTTLLGGIFSNGDNTAENNIVTNDLIQYRSDLVIPKGGNYKAHREKDVIHEGVDISLPIGTILNGPADWTISFRGKPVTRTGSSDLGIVNVFKAPQTEVIDGQEYVVYMVYGHLFDRMSSINNEPLPKIGEIVHENQPVALSGDTGNSEGPHLHIEVRLVPKTSDGPINSFGNGKLFPDDSISVDPEKYIPSLNVIN